METIKDAVRVDTIKDSTGDYWEDLYLRLFAYAESLIKSKYWFRSTGSDSFVGGKQIHDYVSEAIEKHLQNPEKYDETRGSLIDYLRFNLLRSLVSNDIRSSENKLTADVFAANQNEEHNSSYLDSILPYTEAYFDQQVDYDLIMSEIEKATKGDKTVEEIFLGNCCYGLKRREVIAEFGMSEKDYDNGIRRLGTILERVAKKYNLKA